MYPLSAVPSVFWNWNVISQSAWIVIAFNFDAPVNNGIVAGMSEEIDTVDNAMVMTLYDGVTICPVKIRKLY